VGEISAKIEFCVIKLHLCASINKNKMDFYFASFAELANVNEDISLKMFFSVKGFLARKFMTYLKIPKYGFSNMYSLIEYLQIYLLMSTLKFKTQFRIFYIICN